MKKIFIAFAGLLLSASLFGQAKKPTLMVVPSDVWCQTNKFVTVLDNQGTQVIVPDYKKALQSDMNLGLVI
ncbi:MAG: DUF6175 family protein, partial [Bacteroidales bacterium]